MSGNVQAVRNVTSQPESITNARIISIIPDRNKPQQFLMVCGPVMH